MNILSCHRHNTFVDEIMKFYKTDGEHFFVQMNKLDYIDDNLIEVNEGNHHGDEVKHAPVLTYEDDRVTIKIGDIMHPMTLDHHIPMIYMVTNLGGQYRLLSHLDTPIVTFTLSEGEVVEKVYAYCQLHGLWKLEL